MSAAITSNKLSDKDIGFGLTADLQSKVCIIDNYKTYLATNAEPDERGHNRFNLFDDVDCLDRKHLLAVRQFIKMKEPL